MPIAKFETDFPANQAEQAQGSQGECGGFRNGRHRATACQRVQQPLNVAIGPCVVAVQIRQQHQLSAFRAKTRTLSEQPLVLLILQALF
jgi:hypothetical protein